MVDVDQRWMSAMHSLLVKTGKALLLQPDKHVGAIIRGHTELLGDLSDMRNLARTLQRVATCQLCTST